MLVHESSTDFRLTFIRAGFIYVRMTNERRKQLLKAAYTHGLTSGMWYAPTMIARVLAS